MQKFFLPKIFSTLLPLMVIAAVLLSACASGQAPSQTQAPTGAEAAVVTQAPATTEAPMETDIVATDAIATESVATEAATEEAAATQPAALANTGGLPEVDPGLVEGDIIAAGSSTVFPLAEAMADRFEEEGYTGQITIDSIGSGAGFERFCVNAETDIANASRAIKDSEVKACQANGRTPIEFRVGTDALAVVVSQENDFATDLTLEEVAKVFSKDAANWSDVRPEWPNEPILRYTPGTDSGTFDFFIEFVMQPVYGKEDDAAKKAALEAGNLNMSEDDNVLVQGVSGSPYAIGYFGYAYYNENSDSLKAVAVNGIMPELETAESGDYPLARPLYIYSDAQVMQSKPQVAAFINFFLSFVNEEIEGVGYFPASAEALDQARQLWLDANP